MEKMNTFYNMSNHTQKDTESIVVDDCDDQEEAALPGFRFHPTDEELVGFYLRRKVDKKPISIELIKQIDIYKFDPWDLPKPNTVGEKEGYFFCKRGRKYRNSIRPNRVTGSGFWKATGIDKPVYSNGDGGDCIGLKKTLVYYRGSAGKGTKTDWMMHEFRLPANLHANPKCDLQEAEVWTLCRIFKRNLTHRKYTSDWRELSSKRNPINKSSKTTNTTTCNSSSIGESTFSTTRGCYFSFGTPLLLPQEHDQKSGVIVDHDINTSTRERSSTTNQLSYSSINAANQAPSYMASSSSNNIWNNPYEDNHVDLFSYGEVDMDELRSVMEFACSHP